MQESNERLFKKQTMNEKKKPKRSLQLDEVSSVKMSRVYENHVLSEKLWAQKKKFAVFVFTKCIVKVWYKEALWYRQVHTSTEMMPFTLEAWT